MMLKIKNKVDNEEYVDYLILSNYYNIRSFDDRLIFVCIDGDEITYFHEHIINLTDVLVLLENLSSTKVNKYN